MADLLERLRTTMDISRDDGRCSNKRDLYIRAIQSYREHQLAQGLALLEREGSPLENVRSVVRFFEARAANAPSRGCLLANALGEMCPHDAEITKLLRETIELLREGLERSLHAARARGELALGESPHNLSWALTNAMIGLAVTGYSGTLSMLE
jgi:TetR/AcrR family transcriptional repressor of nem operon